jgi:Fic family protein
MRTFQNLDHHLGMVPASIASALGAVDKASGQEIARRVELADALDRVIKVAKVQSTEASNAIENIRAPRARIEALVAEKTMPQNRSEAEILGYRDVLNTIHANTTDVPFSNNVLLQFHRDLYAHTNVGYAGTYKVGSNEVTETRPDGTVIVRFRPVDPADTPRAMDDLMDRYADAVRREEHHPLLLLAAYIFDFLMVHPFQDGNGRMSRLITLLLLYHGDYRVGRYVSLERLINDSHETYYEALQASTPGWHESEHDIWRWTSYFVGILVKAYKEFESRLDAVGRKGAKSDAVKTFIRSSISSSFAIEDIRKATPAGDSLIRRVLHELRDMQPPAIEVEGRGPGARWRRIHTDF